eukprot:jgi/Phyca11/13662/fgenesh1_pg.PHYCAscaffold_4_\
MTPSVNEDVEKLKRFVEQMDRIILACFSGASKRVLSSVATQEVWFKAEMGEEEAPREAVTERINPATEVVIKQERIPMTSPSATGGTAADGGGLETREVAGSSLTKRPRSRTSKKKLSTKKPLQELVAEPKEPSRRRADARYDENDTESDEEYKGERKRLKKRMSSLQKDETLHNKQLEINTASQKLRKKNGALDDLNATELSEPGTFADAIATLESEIEKMEDELVGDEAEMAEINSTLDTYWATLNEIGIESRHDKIDMFPDFVTHYAIKKKRK